MVLLQLIKGIKTAPLQWKFLFSSNISNALKHPESAKFHTSFPICVAGIGKKKKSPMKLNRFKKTSKIKLDVITIEHDMTVKDLAQKLGKETDIIFEAYGYIEGTQPLRKNTVFSQRELRKLLPILGYGYNFKESKREKIDKDLYQRPPPSASELIKRPPVVTIMGHVDHGKTTLLDALRKSNVVAQEFGGITQHIGAFTVSLSSGEKITFLDTPGHAAFHAMRARGAYVTDIVVLVVAADDGVMKQTIESIKHAKDAEVPIIIAINKIDKHEADIEGTKTMLIQNGIHIEEYGGEVQVVLVSAIKRLNLDNLLEAIITLAELNNIAGDPSGPIEGSIIESRTDVQRGIFSTAIIQRGTLKKGALLLAGEAWAKVRAIFNDKGKQVTEALPGTAVEILGWKELPHAGQQILQADNEKHAHEVVKYRKEMSMEEKSAKDLVAYNSRLEAHKNEYQQLRKEKIDQGYSRTKIYSTLKHRNKEERISYSGPELAIVIKADVDGSLDAILDVLNTYNSKQCRLHILSYGVGDVVASDVEMAASFNGMIYAFNTKWNSDIQILAEKQEIPIYSFNVIYKFIDDLKEKMNSILPKVQQEEITGEGKVLEIFSINDGKKNKIPVAGCRCVKGSFNKSHLFRLVRDGEVILTGNLDSLKHFKQEVDKIQTGTECGLSFTDKSIEIQRGDEIICYKFLKVEQQLDWDLQF